MKLENWLQRNVCIEKIADYKPGEFDQLITTKNKVGDKYIGKIIESTHFKIILKRKGLKSLLSPIELTIVSYNGTDNIITTSKGIYSIKELIN